MKSDTWSLCLMNFIYKMRKEKVFHYMIELKDTEKMTKADLNAYKNAKIVALISYLRDNITYYSDLIPSLQLRVDDAYESNMLPVLDKYIIKNNISSFVDKKMSHAWRSTSGTTGSPFVFPKDKVASGYMDAMMYNVYSWHGINLGDKQARLWGRCIKLGQRLTQSIKDFLLNRRRLSAFDMNNEKCIRYYNKLKKYKPKYYYAYSNALYQFACFVENHNLDGKILQIGLAICTGEVLFDYQRNKIANVFDCRVVNEYGSTENGIIAFECEYGMMHILPTIKIEIINPDASGMGEVVITELNSRSIPFVRYKIGDRGRLLAGDCKCGRPYEMFELQEGRVDAYIRCPDGSIVYDAILAYSLKDFAVQFKAYQEKVDYLKILVIPNADYNANGEEKLRKLLKKYLGNDMVISIVLVNEIPSEPSGKLRYFVPLIGEK